MSLILRRQFFSQLLSVICHNTLTAPTSSQGVKEDSLHGTDIGSCCLSLQTVKTSVWFFTLHLLRLLFIKRLLEWRSNWDQSTSQKTKLCWITTVFFILFSCQKQNKLKPRVFTSKSTAKSLSNSGLHSEEKGNLKTHQPISQTEKNLLLSPAAVGGSVHKMAWSADCTESVRKTA